MIKPAAHSPVIIIRQGAQVGVDPETGLPVFAITELPGFHVNAAWCRGDDMPSAWAATQIDPEPATPFRQFSGLPDENYDVSYHRFDDEATYLAALEGS